MKYVSGGFDWLIAERRITEKVVYLDEHIQVTSSAQVAQTCRRV